MALKIKSFKELLEMGKEKLEETLIPLRVRAAKAKAETSKVKLETDLVALEAQIHTACAAKEPDFEKIADLLDDYDLKERRLKQITMVVEQLFPEAQ